jgi:filamentous hemagglutinin family protein
VRNYLLKSLLIIATVLIGVNYDQSLQAQITPDQTLDEESSRVTPNVEINSTSSTRIDGGASRGANLFHSFGEFNVGEGQGAYFTNPAGIENILGRVTGGNPSEILGTLGVSGGDANLFLINPNGIIFGANASLDVGGSFMATTANSIGLGESGSFNATQPQTSKLLSVNPSALFFNAVAAQSIVNRSQAVSPSGETNSLGDSVGLQVPEGKSLALVGGNIFLNGGNLTVTGGKIELGSVAGAGEISLNQSGDSWLLKYEEIETFGDIRIEGAAVESLEGSAKIETGNLIVSDGAQVFTGTYTERDGGDLNINASESIQVIGTSRDDFYGGLHSESDGLYTESRGGGDAGNLTIKTSNLIVRDSAVVSTSTYKGKGGDLNINASESIQVIGETKDSQFPGLSAHAYGIGDAGDINLFARQLTLNNSFVISGSSTGGSTVGNITLNVFGTLLVNNSTINNGAIESSGAAINITAGDIRLLDNSDIRTHVFFGGNGGDINLTADSIVAFDDSDILAFTSDGSGGDINLNTPVFFADGYQPSNSNTNLNFLNSNANNQVDINASGTFNGIITVPDVSFIQNNLATLPQVFINTDDLIASSCIARRNQQTGSFFITGNDSLPTPSKSDDSSYPTGTVQTIPSPSFDDGNNHPWQKGDPIIEPTGVYRLPNGELVMSRECSQ